MSSQNSDIPLFARKRDVGSAREMAADSTAAVLTTGSCECHADDACEAGMRLGKYVCVRELGVGASARVWLAECVTDGERVAVKIARGCGSVLARSNALLTAEVRTMLTLGEQVHMVHVLDHGVSEDGRVFVVLPFAQLGSLQDRIRRQPLHVEEVLDVGIAVAQALAVAHQHGVIHCDVKPSNILQFAVPANDNGDSRLDTHADGDNAHGETSSGIWAIADFGVATSVYDASSFGFSLPWAAPELLHGAHASEVSDVYALGATLAAALLGKPPHVWLFGAMTRDELRQCIGVQHITHLRCDRISAPLERVLCRALCYDANDRYSSMREFAQALQELQLTPSKQTPTALLDSLDIDDWEHERRAIDRELQIAYSHDSSDVADCDEAMSSQASVVQAGLEPGVAVHTHTRIRSYEARAGPRRLQWLHAHRVTALLVGIGFVCALVACIWLGIYAMSNQSTTHRMQTASNTLSTESLASDDATEAEVTALGNDAAVAAPTLLEAIAHEDAAYFSWTADDATSRAATFVWQLVDDASWQSTDVPYVSVPWQATDREHMCINVRTVANDNRVSSDATLMCVTRE